MFSLNSSLTLQCLAKWTLHKGRCIDVFVGLNCLYLETHNMFSKQAVQK